MAKNALTLLTRDAFREAVFERDGYACVVCSKPAVDAHHLYERKLWGVTEDGGYFLANGVSLCEKCHKEAEATDLSVELLCELADIPLPPLPSTLESGHVYDKWGNILLSDGLRMRGPLFYDVGVQRALAARLHEYTHYVKYPRTPHLPWSPGASEDDLKWTSASLYFRPSTEVVVTEKMDGENTTIYKDYLHARSIDSGYHASRSWVKNFAAQWQHELSPTQRIVGENMYAVHSLKYTNLKSYFYGIAMWQEGLCYTWDNTVNYFELLGIEPAPVIAKGIWRDVMSDLAKVPMTEREGYVVRNAGVFLLKDFGKNVAKYVRANHVTSDSHWKHGKIDKNELA
jgi:hypothetical protein